MRHGHMHGRHRDSWGTLWDAWWRGPAPRADRGVIRLLILDAISTEPRHGYEIIHAIGQKSGGVYKPSPGVIYPTLQLLEDLDFARASEKEERKVYAITAKGKAELEEHLEQVNEFYEGSAEVSWDSHPEVVMHVMKRVGHLVKLFKKGVRRGTIHPSTLRQIKSVLDRAIDELEELLEPDEL